MFELGYFSGSKEQVPAGWGAVDEDKEYPRLSSRDPKPFESIEEPMQDTTMGNGASPSDAGSDDSNEADAPLAPTRMTEESSDEEDIIPNNNTTRVCSVLNFLRLHILKMHPLKPLFRSKY
jgi:ubiquitin carboxyl-terminal hydrolase 4/11/15